MSKFLDAMMKNAYVFNRGLNLPVQSLGQGEPIPTRVETITLPVNSEGPADYKTERARLELATAEARFAERNEERRIKELAFEGAVEAEVEKRCALERRDKRQALQRVAELASARGRTDALDRQLMTERRRAAELIDEARQRVEELESFSRPMVWAELGAVLGLIKFMTWARSLCVVRDDTDLRFSNLEPY